MLLFIWLVAVEIGVETWYRMHERGTIATPAWSVRWPEDASGYREIKTDERVRELLRFDSAHEALWRSPNSAETNYMFFFRWNPGSGTKSLFQYELILRLSKLFHLAQEFYWFNPSRLPTPAQAVMSTRSRLLIGVLRPGSGRGGAR